MKRRTLALVLALAGAALGETVEIRSAADWDNFAKRVNDGEFALNAVLVRDVTLSASSPRCGTSNTRYYKGNFDGNGKTLTVAINVANAGSDNPAAPFPYVTYGANIHDLHVAGTIQTDGKFASGICGCTTGSSSGDVKLTRCRVSAAITCTMTGDTTSAGLFACAANTYPDVRITDCLFDGKLLGPNANNSGGFVGWRNSAYVYVYDSLFDPAEVTLGASGSYTLVRPSFNYSSHCDNVHYTQAFGSTQGLRAVGKTAAQLASALGENWQVVNNKAVPKMTVSITDDSEPDPNSGVIAFAYQGVLKDAQGNALSKKDHTIAFRVYDQATGGSPHWGRSQKVLLDANGMFSVEISDAAGDALSDGTPATGLADVIANNAGTSLYLGLAVDGAESEISPRQRILASPLASFAADVAAASGDFAATNASSTVVKAANMTVSGNVVASSVTASDGIAPATAATAGNATVGGNLTVKGVISGAGEFPLGGILVWSGAANAVPDGWALCNGQTSNGRQTPDLRDRFIVGAGGAYAVGATGGAAMVALTTAQMPPHTHALNGRYCGYTLKHNNDHEVITYKDKDWGSMSEKINDSNSTGGGQPHENRPPYYALCYIMRVK